MTLLHRRRLAAGDRIALGAWAGGVALDFEADGDAALCVRLEWRGGDGVWRPALAPPPAPRTTLALDAAAAPIGLRAARAVCDGPAVLTARRWFPSQAAFRRALAGDPAAFVLGGAPRRLPRAWRPGRAQVGATLARLWALAETAPAPSAGPGPELSLLTPVFDADPAWLDALTRSVRDQATGLAELILADDGSRRPATRAWLDAHAAAPDLTVLRLPRNSGVAAATNAALAAARGRWAAPIDHDDVLAPNAVARVVTALRAHPQARFLYTDEARVDAALRPIAAYFKPAFDPVLLSGVNYINHLSVYDRGRLTGMGGFATGFDGAQDYEMTLRYCRDLRPDEILHLPYPAYLWRQPADSFSTTRLDEATAAARRALAARWRDAEPPVAVEPAPGRPDLHRLRRRRAAGPPAITAIVPNRDSPALIDAALEGLLERTDYPPLRVVVVDNGSTDPRTLAVYARRSDDPRVTVEIRPAPFNFSAMVNRGADIAGAQDPTAHLLLFNNDVTPEEPDWLREMADCLEFPRTGVVGARLLFPDRRIQHAGVILGLGGLVGHWFYKQPEATPGPMGRLGLRCGMTVVTGACLLASRRCWDALGGFDATQFPVAYNDVDFCARARESGHGVVWTPFATLIHHESASRGSDKLPRNLARFRRDQARLRALWATDAFDDPAFSPLWTRYRSLPRPTAPAMLPPARPAMAAIRPHRRGAPTG